MLEKVTTRTALLIAITATTAVMQSNLALSQDLNNPERNALIYGKPLSGRIIVSDLRKTCDHLTATLKTADRNQRVLLFTNLDASTFATHVCNETCDQLELNNSLVACRDDKNIKGCRIYGALYQDEIFQFSVDQHGTVLEKQCGLKK
jgi:hypothetical protein